MLGKYTNNRLYIVCGTVGLKQFCAKAWGRGGRCRKIISEKVSS